ncbi:hypothetical protein [Bradyrhizobium sp. WD16]|uniref:hypothetical protein n=1 Tax=Bradyrhizobium sp. WD16 TaxID=1521768 RepID=UPI0020A3E468|nr:hypothetical protein [Bradyrhizobium sp. WD16]UTD29047.1 hypothetical protein DB459_21250 [Bradyrhizobium sp. WD16]
MKIRLPPIAIVALLALCIVNAALLNLILDELNPAVDVASPLLPHDANRTAPPAPIGPKPIAAFTRILERPAFFKSRSPWVGPPPAVAKPVPQLPQTPDLKLVVTGIIIKDNLKKAFVVKPNEQQGAWITEGEIVGGWTIKLIEPGGIAIQQNGRTLDFALYPAK